MKKNNKMSKTLRGVSEYAISVGTFVIIWYIYVSVKDVPAYVLPSPGKVGKGLVELFKSGTVWPHLGTTTFEVILGFAAGAFLGILLGYVFVKIDFLKTALMPYLIFAQTAPKIALVPLFVVWFGIGLVSKIVLIISMVLFPVLSGTMLGMDSIPKDVRNLMKVLKASKWQIFTKIEMPYSLPALFSSFKIGIVQAVIGAIVAEWMSGKQGLGYILTFASSTYDTPMLLAGIIVTIILGIVTYEIVNMMENKALYWHESKQI
jgi:NitT/TauT family transport system permease protein